MSAPSDQLTSSSMIASLYVQALRQGLALWFKVTSGSMRPLLAIGSEVYISPVPAQLLQIGDIAAFETSQGVVVHRIVACRRHGSTMQFLQMADVDLYPSWIEDDAVVGRVIAVRQESTCIDLQHPLAKRLGRATAHLRYWLAQRMRHRHLRGVLHACSRVVAHLQYRLVQKVCLSWLISDEVPYANTISEQEKEYAATE